jgi:hypothetical protein
MAKCCNYAFAHNAKDIKQDNILIDKDQKLPFKIQNPRPYSVREIF